MNLEQHIIHLIAERRAVLSCGVFQGAPPRLSGHTGAPPVQLVKDSKPLHLAARGSTSLYALRLVQKVGRDINLE